MRRGPHPSTVLHYAPFLLEDFYDYVKMGYWLVLPYHALRGHPRLKIAPAGVVPQRERRPRPIMDYSYNAVNQHTLPLAPFPAMQFGHALQRFLQRLAYCNPVFGPPLLAKIGMANGYYRIPFSADASLQLADCLPSDNSRTPLLGIPLSLPMGWNLSPPYFCSFTETCADLTNHHPIDQPQHPFTEAVQPQVPVCQQNTFHREAILPYNPTPATHPMAYTDVYMDDFLLAAQQPRHTPLMHTLLHHIHQVFADPHNSPRRLIVSASKVQKGDASFSTKKSILGWNIDSHSMTLQLPEHRLDKIKHTLQRALTSNYTTRRRWQKILGELRSMVPALHSSKYLFSILQTAFQHRHTRRIRLTTILKMALQSWQHIMTNATRHPVPITHLIPHAPHYYAAVDASQLGMGGFWMPTILTPDTQPVAWRHQWDKTIAQRLVTQENPSGDLNNSMLELTAFVTGQHVQHAHTPPMPHTTTVTATDNTPTQA
jgi:hypothetical protein